MSKKPSHKSSPKPKGKSVPTPNFQARTIEGSEIYYRTEWVITGKYAPGKPHVYAPNTALSVFWHNLTLEELWARFRKLRDRIDNVLVPYDTTLGHPGVADVTNFGQLFICVVVAFETAGWTVNLPHAVVS